MSQSFVGCAYPYLGRDSKPPAAYPMDFTNDWSSGRLHAQKIGHADGPNILVSNVYVQYSYSFFHDSE